MEFVSPLTLIVDKKEHLNKDENVQMTKEQLFAVTMFLVAVVIAWSCNDKENLLIRILTTIFAGIFAYPYLIYFATNKYILNKSIC